MYSKVQDPRFEITDYIIEDTRMYCTWDFKFSTPLLNWGKPMVIAGSSHVTCDSDGVVTEHIDYWDASTQIYMQIPVIGWFFRFLSKLF